MRPFGRRSVALVGLIGTMAFSLCVAAAGSADAQRSTDVELTTKEIGLKENVLGDVVADAIRARAKADVALIDASAFEEQVSIPKGKFSDSDLLKALSYKSDNIFVLKLTGEQLRSALEHGLFLYPKFNSAFLQFSGMTVTVNPAGGAEKHVVSIKVNGDTLDSSKTYSVAMRAPLANGGLAYSKIWKNSDKKDTQQTLEAAITAYLSDHPTVTKGEDRLVPKGK
ncbi:MAG: 5-nucleotidase, C-terminal domain [Chthonomonadales bacterium]|nr:5-nucleotidase, C-terminal domain [Chthonomonadales bacterium]